MIGRLHVITPTSVGANCDVTRAVLRAGVPVLQVRCKDVTDRDRLDVAGELRAAAAAAGATCLINDRVDIALAVRADGVHVGADDVPVRIARGLLGDAAIVGATARNSEQARQARDEGASYLGVGPCYASTTKTVGLPDPIGPAGIAAVTAAVDLPVIAIAGVTLDRVPELRDAGAHGIAVVGAVYDAPRPADAAKAFLEALG